MIKSVSLKEFSTTPTVSYMLSKDGKNIASHIAHHTRNTEITPPVIPQGVKCSPHETEFSPSRPIPHIEEDEMYEIE